MTDLQPTMTLEDLTALLRKKFLRLSNLFHRKDGLFQANVRAWNGPHYGFGYGVGPEIALQRAIEKAIAKEGATVEQVADDDRPHDQVPFDQDPDAPETFEDLIDDSKPAADPDIDDLLG